MTFHSKTNAEEVSALLQAIEDVNKAIIELTKNDVSLDISSYGDYILPDGSIETKYNDTIAKAKFHNYALRLEYAKKFEVIYKEVDRDD